MIKIERRFETNQDGERHLQSELIAELPERSDTFDTGVGEIHLLVCPPNFQTGVQKFVFEGKIMEKNCKGGTTLRRVVKLPLAGQLISQDISVAESLVFSLDRKR